MSENESGGNPFLDLWMTNQRLFFKDQDDWLSPSWNMMEQIDAASFAEKSKKNWKQCEDQFENWVKATSNLFSPSSAASAANGQSDYSTEALHQMLNPENFMNSGFFNTSEIFKGILNGPEFADFGVLEKKILKNGRDWLALNEAGDEYQKVVALAWSRAFKEYSDEFVEYSANNDIDTQYLLDLWLKIADQELVSTLRSEEFLEAQRNLFSAATAYKLKHREFAEMWCENNTIPTRSEVDDLHKMVHELRREVRQLKRQAASAAKVETAPAEPMKTTAAKTTTARKTTNSRKTSDSSKATTAKKATAKVTTSAKPKASQPENKDVTSSKGAST